MSLNIIQGTNSPSSKKTAGLNHGKYTVLGEDGTYPKEITLAPRNIVEEDLQKKNVFSNLHKTAPDMPVVQGFVDDVDDMSMMSAPELPLGMTRIESTGSLSIQVEDIDDRSVLSYFERQPQQPLFHTAQEMSVPPQSTQTQVLPVPVQWPVEEPVWVGSRNVQPVPIEPDSEPVQMEAEAKANADSEAAPTDIIEPVASEPKERQGPYGDADEIKDPSVLKDEPREIQQHQDRGLIFDMVERNFNSHGLEDTSDEGSSSDPLSGDDSKSAQEFSDSTFKASLWLWTITFGFGIFWALQHHSFFNLELCAGLAILLMALPPLWNSKYDYHISTKCSSWLLVLYAIKLLVCVTCNYPNETHHLQTQIKDGTLHMGHHHDESIASALKRRRFHYHGHSASILGMPTILEYGIATGLWTLVVCAPHLVGVRRARKQSLGRPFPEGGAEMLGVLVCVAALVLQGLALESTLDYTLKWSKAHALRGELGLSEQFLLGMGELLFWVGIIVLNFLHVRNHKLLFLMAGAALMLCWTFQNPTRLGPNWTDVSRSASKASVSLHDMFDHNQSTSLDPFANTSHSTLSLYDDTSIVDE